MATDEHPSAPPSTTPKEDARIFWVALGVLALLAGLCRLVPVGDADTPWHLYAGEDALRHRWMRWPDDTSFTVPGREYVSYPWLGDVIMALIFRALGWPGLVLFSAACAAAATVFNGLLARRAAGDRVWLALFVTALAAGATSYTFEARPQALFMVFVPLALLALDDFAEAEHRRGAMKSALQLAGLQLLWCHVHASFILVPALAGVALFRVLEARGLRAAVERAWLPIGLFAITLLGPGGPRYYVLLAQVSGGDAVRHIAEMKALEVADLLPRYANSILWLDLLLLVGAVRSIWNRRARLDDVARVLVGLVLVATARRLRAPWAIMALPLAARDLARAPLPAWGAKFERLAGLAAVLLVLPTNASSALARDPGRGFGLGLHQDEYPYDSAEAIARAGLQGNIFNEYTDGGYLTFRLRPAVKIAIDGRTPTLFDDELYFLLRRAMSDPHAFEVVEKRWPLDLALIFRAAPLCRRLAQATEWRASYVDRDRTLFVRRGEGRDLPALDELDPCAPEASIGGVCARGSLGPARREIDALAAVVPEAWYPALLSARLEVACGGDRERLLAAAAALESRTREPIARRVAAEALFRAGEPAAALTRVDIPDDGRRADALVLRARIRVALEDFAGAASDLLEVAKILDDLTPAHLRLELATALARAGRTELALREAQRAFWVSGSDESRRLLLELGGAP